MYFSKETLEALTNILIAGSTPLTDELVDSTATELMNMIYSGAKNELNDNLGYLLPSAIPTLVKPREKSEGKDLFILPMASPIGTFYLEIDLSTV